MQRWTVQLEGGPRRVNHAAVCIGDKIYSFGGYCTGEDYETRLPIDVHVLDTVSLRWKLLKLNVQLDGTVPYQRYGHSAVGYQEGAYIWGGRNDSDGACNILFMFNTVTSEWSCVKTSGDIPGARDGHSACLIIDKMYIYGGYEERIDRFSDDVYSYDFSSKVWTHLKTKGLPARWRDFHTAIGIGHVMYVFGGRSDLGGDTFTNREIYSNKIQTFDTKTLTWHEPAVHGNLPIGRRSHSVFTYNDCMYIFGGYNGIHNLHLRTIYKFNPVSSQWSEVPVPGQGPCARRRQCCCRLGSQVFLFGGTSPNNQDAEDEVESEGTLTDLSDLHVLDLDPSLKTLAQLEVIRNKLDTRCLPSDLRWELAAMTTPNTITRSANSNG